MRDFHTAYQEAKSLPSSALHDEMRNGSGNIPEFIVMAELDSRAAIQGGGKRPKITVRDEMMMGLPPPQMEPQMPTNGFSDGGLISYYNRFLGMDELGKPHDIAEQITNALNLQANNQPDPQAPAGLQSLTQESGKTALNMPEPGEELKKPVRFASGGVVGGQVKYTKEELDLLAQAMASEAGNQKKEGLYGVGYNILNRVGSDKYPNTIKEVVLQRGQYSAFNDVTGYNNGKGANSSGRKYSPAQYKAAEDVAYGRVENPIGSATNYYNPALASPSWGPGMKNQTRIGDHVFGTASGGGPRQHATHLPRSRPPQETTTRTEMVNLTSESEDKKLLTVLTQMAAAKRETLLPKADLRMARADEYSEENRDELDELIARYGGNV